MKDYLLLLSFTAIIFVGCSNQMKDQKYLGLKGKIESIKDTEYSVKEKFGEHIPDDVEAIIIYKFNKEGYLSLFGIYSEDGDLRYQRENIYDHKNECIETKFNSRSSNTHGKLVERTAKTRIWEYLESNKWNDEKSKVEKTVHTEIDHSRRHVIALTKIQGSINSKEETWYDKNMNTVEYKETDDEGNISQWQELKYNKKNELIEFKEHTDDKQIITFKYQKHDNKGNWTERITYRDSEVKTITTREIKYR